MLTPFTLVHDGRRFELTTARDGDATRVHLTVDGALAVDQRVSPPGAKLDLGDAFGGVKVGVRALLPGRVQGVALVLPEPAVPIGPKRSRAERIAFEPPAGTRAHRLYRYQEAHPTLYAVRHVVVAVVQVLLLLLGLRLAINLIPWGSIPFPNLPSIDLPHIPLPSIPLPHIPLPEVTLPDWHLPGWVHAVLESKKYWMPILLAVFVASREVDRRNKRKAAAAAKDAEEAPTVDEQKPAAE